MPRFPLLAWLFLFTAWGAAGIVSFWTLQRPVPVELAIPLEVMTPQVRPGEQVQVRFCVHRKALMATQRLERLFDGSGAETEEQTPWRYAVGELTVGGSPDCYVQGMRVPDNAAPGWGRYRVIVSWRAPFNLVHLFWPVVHIFPDARFEILRGDTPH